MRQYDEKTEEKIMKLQARIDRIHAQLLKLGPLRSGGLTQQYNVCGTPGCACKRDPKKRHGPYHILRTKTKTKDGTKYVKKDFVRMVQGHLAAHKKMRELIDRWVDLSAQICDLQMQ